MFEDYLWVPALLARYGDKLKFAGENKQTFIDEFLSATPDGLLVDQSRNALADFDIDDIGGDGSIVVECKTIDPRIQLTDAKTEHVYQVHVQMGLIRELTPHRPEYAIISYTNASFLDDTVEFAVRFDPEIFAYAKQRAAEILTARAAKESKPEGWITGGKECGHCPYTKACGVVRHDVPTEAPAELVDPQFVAEISDLAHEVKQRRADLDVGTTALRALEHEIRERLHAKGMRKIVGDGISVTWRPVKGRPTYDWKGIREAAAEAGVDLSKFETVGEMSSRLDIGVIGRSRSAA